MTDPNWKPHPGKPAMTRDGKTLVTDLRDHGGVFYPLRSDKLSMYWTLNGEFMIGSGILADLDLIEPTAAILAAHGIDADGKPVAKAEEVTPYPVGEVVGACVCGSWPGGGCLRCPRIPAPPTRIDMADVAYISAIKLAEIMELAKRQPYGTPIAIDHDGFKGVVIGWYVRLDGVTGVVAQLDDARVVHVYGEKWLKPAPEVAKREGR